MSIQKILSLEGAIASCRNEIARIEETINDQIEIKGKIYDVDLQVIEFHTARESELFTVCEIPQKVRAMENICANLDSAINGTSYETAKQMIENMLTKIDNKIQELERKKEDKYSEIATYSAQIESIKQELKKIEEAQNDT